MLEWMKGFALLVVAACGCAVAPVPEVIPVREATVEVGRFRVPAPRGSGWGMVRVGDRTVRFTRTLAHLESPVGAVEIAVGQAEAGADDPRDEEALAAAVVEGELRTMQREGVKSGLYQLLSVERGVDTVGGRKLHGMRYETKADTVTTESAFRLWFPPDFPSTGRFYWMLATVSHARGAPYSVARADPSEGVKMLAGLAPASPR